MSKTIISPVKRFPGEVVLKSPVTFPVYLEWRRSVEAATNNGEGLTVAGAAFDDEITLKMLPGICAMVERWGLENFPASPTPDTFPATPRRSIGMLLVWLIGEISAIITEDDELPNA